MEKEKEKNWKIEISNEKTSLFRRIEKEKALDLIPVVVRGSIDKDSLIYQMDESNKHLISNRDLIKEKEIIEDIDQERKGYFCCRCKSDDLDLKDAEEKDPYQFRLLFECQNCGMEFIIDKEREEKKRDKRDCNCDMVLETDRHLSRIVKCQERDCNINEDHYGVEPADWDEILEKMDIDEEFEETVLERFKEETEKKKDRKRQITPSVNIDLQVGDRIYMGDNIEGSVISSIEILNDMRGMIIKFKNNKRSILFPLDQFKYEQEVE